MDNNENTKKHSIRNDVILIGCILLAAAVGIIYLNFFRSPGDMVTVTVDGENYGSFSLAENICEDIYSVENEEKHNRFIISDGKAYMEKASCPDGICVDHKPVFRDGESIVCLPNRVVITVVDGSTDSPDIII